MPSGPDLAMLWFLGSAVACLLLLVWIALTGLASDGYRLLSVSLLIVVAGLTSFPSVLVRIPGTHLPLAQGLLIGSSLLLAAALAVLLRMRKNADLGRRTNLGLAAVGNLWVTILVLLVPLLVR